MYHIMDLLYSKKEHYYSNRRNRHKDMREGRDAHFVKWAWNITLMVFLFLSSFKSKPELPFEDWTVQVMGEDVSIDLTNHRMYHLHVFNYSPVVLLPISAFSGSEIRGFKASESIPQWRNIFQILFKNYFINTFKIKYYQILLNHSHLIFT